MATPSYVPDLARRLDEHLASADRDLAQNYPGDPTDRGPIHTVYVPGDTFAVDTVRTWGDRALTLLDDFAPDAASLAEAVGAPAAEVEAAYGRMRAALQDNPIQDLRVDFEDGYGRRTDETEDTDVGAAADAVTALLRRPERPTWWGIRFKAFEAPTRERGLRTLATFVDRVRDQVGDGLTLTLPKVTSVAQVEAMAHACDSIEQAIELRTGSLRFEIQVETAQAIMAGSGIAPLAPMIRAGRGRVSSLHYGTFDYSAGLGIAAAYQSLDHPVADHAKNVMQVSAAQTGVRMSDGSTNVVAFGDRDQAHATWRLHHGLVQRSLERGIYQGWDMHPGHLPTRHLANILFFRRAMPSACARLTAYLDRTSGDVMDEPATARMLATALLRGVNCGAIDDSEIEAGAGISVDRLAELTR